ncbi:MAG TPA: hypothetical protein DDY59_15345 [Lachnospiraceae bacterium]|nr:hypothetical protein [Lachnospiraceae bacterium]
MKMDMVFTDWTSLYFEAPQKDIFHVGYSRSHRLDRPRVTVGLSMDGESGMPIRLTVNPGNILDMTHFDDTVRQVLPLMPEDAMVVFDNGAYSTDNAKLLDSEGPVFVTRLRLNTTDDKFVRNHKDK